jgi:hypothetical protein
VALTQPKVDKFMREGRVRVTSRRFGALGGLTLLAAGSGADMALTGIGAFGWVGGFIGTSIDYTYALDSALVGRPNGSGE